MAVNQIAVFLENCRGRLREVTDALGKEGVNLVALNIADTGEFGILRIVTRDNDRAANVLREAGFTVQLNSLIAAEVADQAGGLSSILKFLSDENIDVEYLYSFAHTKHNTAVILLRVDDDARAAATLKRHKVKLLEEIV